MSVRRNNKWEDLEGSQGMVCVRLEHRGLKKTCQGAHNLPPKQQETGPGSKVPEDLSLTICSAPGSPMILSSPFTTSFGLDFQSTPNRDLSVFSSYISFYLSPGVSSSSMTSPGVGVGQELSGGSRG